ncbi:MAG: hypothetical protein KAS07_05365, partial [Candidatus Pacebacteria bacterium]|nr:hypothetical protein [Candidatus Paceibacterota bacterium]
MSNQNKKAHGQIRQSQIITTFGPGALLDLPNYSVIVGGLDDWHKAKEDANLREIFEARLLDKLRTTLEIFDLRMYEP